MTMLTHDWADHIVAAAGEGGSIGVWDTGKGFLHAFQLNIEPRIKVLAAIPPIHRIPLIHFKISILYILLLLLPLLIHQDLLEQQKTTDESFPEVMVVCSTGLIIILSLSTGTPYPHFLSFSLSSFSPPYCFLPSPFCVSISPPLFIH